MKMLSLAALALVALCASCVTTSVTALGPVGRFKPVTPDEVTVYLNKGDIPGQYEKLALIHARGDSFSTDQNQMISKARKQAAQLGANGLLLTDLDEASQGVKVAATFLGANTQRHGEMIAIYVHPGTQKAAEQAEEEEVPEQSFEEWLSEREAKKND
jgi:hypothetical protein